jgi:hypothetical protein
VFDQTAPEVLAEVRQLAWQGFQRRDEPLELSPADAALPDFRRKGVPLCQEDSNHRISGGCKVFTLQDNSHEAIIEPAVFDQVQAIIRERSAMKGHSGVTIYSSKVKCECCGGWYGSKVWHSTDRYSKVVWQCNAKFKDKTHCSTPHLTEEEIQDVFISVVNQLIADKEEILDGLK